MVKINKTITCPYCGSARVHQIDDVLFFCMDCQKQILHIMKTQNIKEEDNLNKKKTTDNILSTCDKEMQDSYLSMKANLAEGYENIEASKNFEMVNE